jgi:hypothetical protein
MPVAKLQPIVTFVVARSGDYQLLRGGVKKPRRFGPEIATEDRDTEENNFKSAGLGAAV